MALGPRVGGDDDFVLGQKDAGGEDGLLQQAAAVATQVEQDPFRASALDLAHTPLQQGVGAFAEGDQADVAELARADRDHLAADYRQFDLGPGQAQLTHLAGPGPQHADGHLGPFRTFDPRRCRGAAFAGDRFAVNGDDHVADLDPRRGRRRAMEDPVGAEAALDLGDAEPDPGEAPGDRFVEVLERFWREVFGESVVVAFAQLADQALQRGVGELLLPDLAVVVVLDHFGRFRRQPDRFGDEKVADGSRQLAGVATEPEAEREEEDQRRAEGDGRAGPHRELRP